MISNELDLEIQTVYKISQIMEKKKAMKENTLERIEKLKNDLRSFEASAAKQIKNVLTDEQYEKYLKEIKPKLEKLSEERLENVKLESDK
jgi:hypothetical protein